SANVNVANLFENIEIPFQCSEWRLFIDSSLESQKAVLPHSDNQFPSISLLSRYSLKKNTAM
ncbi:unnamed protein product, partial [Larinioides sclopetarius]